MWYASAVSINVTPSSRAARIVAIERTELGRPSIDINMAPNPMALTFLLPI
jgi:hypothetical protein